MTRKTCYCSPPVHCCRILSHGTSIVLERSPHQSSSPAPYAQQTTVFEPTAVIIVEHRMHLHKNRISRSFHSSTRFSKHIYHTASSFLRKRGSSSSSSSSSTKAQRRERYDSPHLFLASTAPIQKAHHIKHSHIDRCPKSKTSSDTKGSDLTQPESM